MSVRSWFRRTSRTTNRRVGLGLQSLENREAPATGLFDGTFFNSGRSTVNFAAGNLDESAQAVVVQSDGKIVIVGSAFDGTDSNFGIVRLNRDGTLDDSFSGDGKQLVLFDLGGGNEDRATCVDIQRDGKIVVGGFAKTTAAGFNFAVCRLNADGTLDNDFSGDGKLTFDVANNSLDDRAFDIAVSGRNIVLAGTARVGTNDDFAAARVLDDGTLDNSFAGDGKQTVAFDLGGTNNDQCEALIVRPDGKVVLGGSVPVGTSGAVELAMTQLNADGTLDTTFGFQPPGKVHVSAVDFAGSVHHLTDLVQRATGEFLLVGYADGPGGRDMVVVGLDSNGSSFDPTLNATGKVRIDFDLGATNNDEVHAAVVQPDGKILLAGTVDLNNGDQRFAAVRLLPNGTLDPTFERDGKAVFAINNVNAQPDGCFDMALTPEGIILVGESDQGSNGLDFAVMRTIRDEWIVASADFGGPPTVKVMTPTGTVLYQFDAFAPTFKGGVRVASADVNGDFTPDLFCAPGPGTATIVRIFDPVTQLLIKEIPVIAPTFKGGINIAVGDVHSSAGLELIVTRHVGSALVWVYSVNTGQLIKRFLGFPGSVGLRVGVGDVIAGGFQEVIVNPRARSRIVRAWDVNAPTSSLVKTFVIGGSIGVDGLFIANDDFNDASRTDLLIGRGVLGLPVVSLIETNDGVQFNELLPFPTAHTRGVRVAAVDVDGDGRSDAIMAKGPGAPPEVTIIDPDTGFRIGSFLAFDPAVTSGLFVLGVFR